MVSCPRAVTAACDGCPLPAAGVLYLHTGQPDHRRAGPERIESAVQCLPAVCDKLAHDINARGKMAYAAYISGLTPANAGLGTVQGIAVPADDDIPGVACGILLPHVLDKIVSKLPKLSSIKAQLSSNSPISIYFRTPKN